MSLATRVLIGLVAGAACGIFFGEYVGFLGVAGNAFVVLLQMSVLPYISLSLVGGLGRLDGAQALSLAKRAGGYLLLFWALALATVLLIPLSYPDWPSASFFSTSLVRPAESIDFVALFIPANPFQALASSVVPAVVLFSIAVGVALIGVEKKQALLEAVTALTDALARITAFVVGLAPYGVFAIVAHAAGTMDAGGARGLEVHAAVYVLMALVLALWTLPGLVVTLTPLRYRDVVWASRDALVTAFATGNVFVVLAVLAAKSREQLRSRKNDATAAEEMVNVVVPTSYTFPSAGKLLALSFVLFAGWLSGFPIAYGQYPVFVTAGLTSFFGSTMLAVPFLLDLFRIPADTFNLFLVADNIVGRFGALVASMHILALTLLAACSMEGLIRIKLRKVVIYVTTTIVLTLGVGGGVRATFDWIGSEYLGYQRFIHMGPMVEPVPTRVLDRPPDEISTQEAVLPMLERIDKRGALRVGYPKDALPFAFRNAGGELVGFDVDMANLLARELGVSLQLVLVDRGDIVRLLEAGYLDTVIGGIAMTTERLRAVSFSAPYLDATLGFVVRDYRRGDFSNLETARALDSPRVAMPNLPYYRERVRRLLPDAELIPLDSVREFFRDDAGRFDALVLTVETGSAWSLLYPEFTVAVPQPEVTAVPFAYAVRHGDVEAADFLSQWVLLKKKDSTVDELFAHWILGEATKSREPRWSVLRNVLGWVD